MNVCGETRRLYIVEFSDRLEGGGGGEPLVEWWVTRVTHPANASATWTEESYRCRICGHRFPYTRAFISR